jgi:tetratricopeptide (TPR) repeat protein
VRAPVLPAVLLCLCACSARDAPPTPKKRPQSAPTVEANQPVVKVDEAKAALEVVDVQLRTGRTRMGEAVRLHVSAWRDSSGPSFSPIVELLGPAQATAERVGDEIVEEKDGRVRERIDFLIEPSEAGTIAISVSATAPLGEPQRHELTLLVTEALPAAELAKQLATQSGRLERGRALAKQGDYKRAIEAFNLALEQQRDDPLVLGEVGWAAFLAGDFSLARRATREALRHQTDAKARGALLYNLGRIAEALKRTEEAIAAYQRSLAVRPDSEPVRMRLDKLTAGRPAPTCIGPSCPLTSAVDGKRACELVEEEGCPLFGQRGACSCDAEALGKLEAIGPWRLLTLTERDPEAGLHHVYFLLADAADSANDDEPRYHVFAPLPGSQIVGGQLRGGVRAAEMIGAGELELLRIDFEGTVDRSSTPDPATELPRGWTLLCAFVAKGRPVCAPPLLSRYQAAGKPAFAAPVVIGSDGSISQKIDSGTAPSRADLDAEFPGVHMQVVTRPMSVTSLLEHAG